MGIAGGLWRVETKGETLIAERQDGPQFPLRPYTYRQVRSALRFLHFQTAMTEKNPAAVALGRMGGKAFHGARKRRSGDQYKAMQIKAMAA